MRVGRWRIFAERRAGFSDESIDFIGPKAEGRIDRREHDRRIALGAGIGAATGALAGGAAGLAIALGQFTPIGPLSAVGAVLAVYVGLNLGAVAGGLFGVLIAFGLSEGEPTALEREVRTGHTLISVHDADERSEEARMTLRHEGGRIREESDIGTYGSGLPATPY
jgi:hypothetical protein